MDPSGPAEPDTLLRAFLEAGEGPEAEGLLSRLIADHAEPVVRGILRQRRRRGWSQTASEAFSLEDVHSQALLQLLARLRAVKARRQDPIGGFLDYVAVTTYRTYYDWLRARYPQRHRLKSRLRYILSRAPGLALWPSGTGGWLCGLASWRGRPRGEAPLASKEAPPSWPSPRAWIEGRPAEFLAQVFQSTSEPMELEELVATVARLCGIPRDPWVPQASDTDPPLAGRSDPMAEAHDRIFLGQMWTEIRRLPVRQRRVLLLSLRDGQSHSLVPLLPLTGAATLRQIAEALEMPAEELAGLWGELPLDDQTLARSMGLQRQQVINLRAAARRRLARRMNLRRGPAVTC